MRDEKKDMLCKIHRLEDKLLRSNDICDQLELSGIIMHFRKQLQKLEREEDKLGV